MKRILYSAALLLALLATGCGDANQKPSALPLIDMNADYPEKEICLQDVAEVNYVPLETTEEMLVAESAEVQSVSSKGIAIKHQPGNMKWESLIFHRNGKGWLKLDKEGQGPDEYDRMLSLVVDWNQEQIFVESFKKMDVYSFELKHLNQFEKKWHAERDYVYDLSDDKLVLFSTKRGESYRPIILISKKDGQVDSLSYVMKKKMNQVIGGGGMQFSVPFMSAWSQGGDVFIDDASCDTIYCLDAVTEQLVPILVHTPAFESGEETEFVLKMKGRTSRYYLLRLESKHLPMEGNKVIDTKSKYLMYDRSDNKAFCPKFKNQDYPAQTTERKFGFLHCSGEKNTFYAWLQAHHLIEALEAGELSGELKTIAEGLKEDDNPVLMVVKFKE